MTNDTEYEFRGIWLRMTNPPPSGTRCLVTDGDVIVIGTYLSDKDSGQSLWLFNGAIPDKTPDTFNVQGWMLLPKPIKKVISYEEINKENT